MGTHCFPLLYTRSRERVPERAVGQSSIGHIDLTFIIISHVETENFAPNRSVETRTAAFFPVWHACDPADVAGDP